MAKLEYTKRAGRDVFRIISADPAGVRLATRQVHRRIVGVKKSMATAYGAGKQPAWLTSTSTVEEEFTSPRHP